MAMSWEVIESIASSRGGDIYDLFRQIKEHPSMSKSQKIALASRISLYARDDQFIEWVKFQVAKYEGKPQKESGPITPLRVEEK